MCRKVKAALANIEARRDKFAHIDDRELDRRKEAVNALEKVRPRARAQRGRAGGRRGWGLAATSPVFSPFPSADNHSHE